MSDHARNTGPMRASPRCGAKIRSGGACRSPAVRGKTGAGRVGPKLKLRQGAQREVATVVS
jgi:hypothetical protein